MFRRPAILEDDHRAHNTRALHVAHVIALDPLRRSLQAERVRELPKRGLGLAPVGEPAHALLFQRVARIPLGELGEVTLLPALRHEDAHRAAAPLGRERFELGLIWDGYGHDDLRRQRDRDRVVLPEERREDVGHAGAFRALE